MKPYRSLLFVPAHKASWVDKGVAAGAHAIILDLEDAVPPGDKQRARDTARASVDRLADNEVGTLVRVNSLDTEHFGADLEAVVRPGLDALLLPKIMSLEDVVAFDALVRHFEIRAGMPLGAVGLVPSLETARGLADVERIAAGPRVVSLMAAAAKDADISREVGFRWTAQGLETLFLRSRVVLAARAAGIPHVVLGLWQALSDLEGLRMFARQNAEIGFGGQVVIHPSHVPTVNEEYAMSATDLQRYRGMVAAYDAALRDGDGAVLYEGEHIDLAHVKHAREVLTQHDENGGER